ncbi:ubinuclein-1-like [Oryza brachyantha]|uniref:ubinuclein-1-like n=1 Tax=Oryza brachyantha TaxID=4533 RepID=UPI001ADAC1DA|nr:ubinuclein-1-like [Oryza brachyantha]
MEDPVAAPSSSSAAAASAVAPLPLAAQQVPAAAAAAAQDAAAGCRRQVFSVELKSGETTIVSWKKLLREAGHAATSPPPAAPALAASEPAFPALPGQPGAVHPPENDSKDPAQPNRFSAVIEKIERLYMGKHSSDEEDLDDVPDDDQYDTEDSFIDDAELDEYFEVDNLKTKHDGYFVNKGKLEQIEAGTSANAAPKKRRRKDSSSGHIENNQVAPVDYSSIGNMPGKSAARSGPHVGKKLTNSNLGYGEYYHEDNRVVKNITGAPGVHKRKSMDFPMGSDTVASTKISSKDMPHASSELKDLEKHKVAAVQPTDFTHRSKTVEAYDYAYSAYRDRETSMQLDFQQKRAYTGENRDPTNKIHRKEKHGMGEFSGMATTGVVYSAQVMPITSREGSGTKPKGTRLERAIRDLEKIAAEYRPPAIDMNELDLNGQVTVKRRLPPEVKQKLAKVARLSANQGKIQEHALMDRLMGIVGHIVQRRTLRRNMKEMVESGLSAKQEKADKFQRVKMEINEMIKSRVAAKAKVNEHQGGTSDDFQIANDDKRSLKAKSVMDSTLEDRICDLYDLYVEGMDEDKGPQSRKLYVELAELWPEGSMDNVGIKDAIYRSKERRKALYNQQKVRSEEKLKRRRLAAAAKLRDGYPVVMQSALVQQVTQPPMTKPVTSYPVTDHGQNQGSKGFDRVREISANPDDANRNAGEMMKKKKRKPESDLVDTQANAVKAPPQPPVEKHKAPKRADEAGGPVLCLPFYDQQPS